jgi:hypothetical protein
VAEDTRNKLEARAEAFVADLLAQDAASPEFGKRVDQLTAMGRKEISTAAGMSNRFLDRPIRAMDKDRAWAPISPSCAARSKTSIRAARARSRRGASSSGSSRWATA